LGSFHTPDSSAKVLLKDVFVRIVLDEKVKSDAVSRNGMGLPAARHDAASDSTVKIESLAQCCFALLARTCKERLSNSAYVPCVISHDKGAARLAHSEKTLQVPSTGISVTLFPFAASTELIKF